MKRIPNNISLANIVWLINPHTRVKVADLEFPNGRYDSTESGTIIYDGLAKDLGSMKTSSMLMARAYNSKVYHIDIENADEIRVKVCTKWEVF